MLSTISSRRRYRNEESMFVTLPYGNPTPGQFFGPPTIGGPPGSRTPVRGYSPTTAISPDMDTRMTTLSPVEHHFPSFLNNSYQSSADDLQSYEEEEGDLMEEEEEDYFETSITVPRMNGIEEASYEGNGQPPYGGPGQPGQPTQPVAPWQPGQGGPAQWNDLPQQPLAHDQVQGPPQDGPPPQEYVQKFDGYNNVGGFGQMAPISPPPPPPPPPQDQAPPQEFSRGAAVDEQACRDAMIKFASEHCCYGKGAAKEHRIDEIKPSNALHYTLESFCESRSTGYAYEPYRGQPIDGPQYGTPPGPWQIQCVPNSMFQTHEKQVEVPHTASVQRCHACKGFGFARCWRCYGMGQNRCQRCGGDGRIERRDADGGINLDHCHSCGGDGRQRCLTCGGDGRITCRVCQGYRQLKCCIMLTCTYTNHLDDHIIEETDMPDELVRGVKGESIFEQSLPQVWPIIAFPNQEINNNSMRLVEKHRTQWPNERILLQRQILRSVAVTEVAYSWKDVKSRYWVYGQEHKIHCPDYPQTCCCTIL